ncbi:hypothetical protein BO78DRAFT_405304 [Aspergillus sclerotiicarbonarius CBS 121057]|uniref:Rhodopsin domain-containing protein n=1 Tax=Aspergillus sclerotiicarbonarius (strain CBS 121057 / IBT 28362) TaxID=1448318 RepID=A0A319EWD7_ASPSB|nr:hypothetical protein BO78DRAFT_405304 [Aspergillus sclerotiicarbonarius CBS 121057]
MSGVSPHLGKANQVVVGVRLALSTSCLVMRIYTKISVMRKFWWDDAASIVYLPCLAFAKLALLMLYYRLLDTVKAWVCTLYLVGFVIAGYTIALTLVLIFACDPVAKNWNPFILEGSCINRNGAYLATAATNTASDLVLLLIPIRVVSKLRMRLIEKLAAIVVFGIGCLTIVTSIVRLVTLWPLVTSKDLSYQLALVCTLVNVEANFIILCGCLPYFRQFIRHFAPKWFPSWWGSRHTHSLSSTSTPARMIRGPRDDAFGEDIEIYTSQDTAPLSVRQTQTT